MPRFARVIPLLLLLLTGAGAAEPLRNSDFEGSDGWTLPPGEAWAVGTETGLNVLRFNGAGAGPVRQESDFLTPGGTYRLVLGARGDGALAPFARVLDQQGRQELARLAVPAERTWHLREVTFKTVTAQVIVELYADAKQLDGPVTGDVAFAAARLEPVDVRAVAGMPDLGENLALGKPYTMEPAPNYSYTTEPGDATQLTDGVYTEGHFWTRPTTVGWSNRVAPLIQIDLGADYPIRGLSFNTAAGAAGVMLPERILIFVSPDGENWHSAGDLIQLHKQDSEMSLAEGTYAVTRLWTDRLATHGRYVAVYVEPTGTYLFVDEIEVYRGDDALLREPYRDAGARDLAETLAERKVTDRIRAQFRRDLEAAESDLAELPDKQQAGHLPRLLALREQIETMPPIPMDGFRAVLPMTDLERDIFRLQAAVWRAQNKPALRVWTQSRWDPLAPSQEPTDDAPVALSIAMMRNEHRAAVFNLTNAADTELRLRLRITGLPGGANPAYLTVHPVEHVGTLRFTSVAAALPEAAVEGADHVVVVPSGMTRQVWLSVDSAGLEPGTYPGAVELSGAPEPVRLPLELRIYPLDFPDQTSLFVGGWTYSNMPAQYGVTPENKDELVRVLKEHYVNAPWATGRAMPSGTFDAEGNFTQEPDTTNLDEFMALWPEAKIYMVFNAVGPTFAGSAMGTPEFDRKVGTWAKFWSDHMEAMGKRPNQLGMLILDEPHEKSQYDIITAWANAIEAAAPGLVTWEDPQPMEAEDCLEMFASVDVLCPYRNPYLARDEWYRELYRSQQAQGRELWFYNADGPVRSFDPFSFYLLQEWHAFGIGAKGSNFWAFGDSGRTPERESLSCWNEYPGAGNGPYTPLYLDATSVTRAKYMEAIREGIQDYEYLTMLTERIGQVKEGGVDRPALKQAEQLLATAVDRVMAGEKGANYRWDEVKDRTVTDTVRVEVLEALAALR